MAHIQIKWLWDEIDCETCGFDSALGAEVRIDGQQRLCLDPRAHCYDGMSYSETDVMLAILRELGHSVENLNYENDSQDA